MKVLSVSAFNVEQGDGDGGSASLRGDKNKTGISTVQGTEGRALLNDGQVGRDERCIPHLNPSGWLRGRRRRSRRSRRRIGRTMGRIRVGRRMDEGKECMFLAH